MKVKRFLVIRIPDFKIKIIHFIEKYLLIIRKFQ